MSRARRRFQIAELLVVPFAVVVLGTLACVFFRDGHAGDGVLLIVATLLCVWLFVRALFSLHHPGTPVQTLAVPGRALIPRYEDDPYARDATETTHRAGAPVMGTASSRSRRRHHSPRYFRNMGLSFFGFGLIALAVTFVGISDADKTSLVQGHGLARTGTVIRASNSRVCDRGCSYTARITVRLAQPISGVSVTTIHTPFTVRLSTGESVRFLVDPREPSWSEFAGHPFYRPVAWIAPLGLALFYWLLAAFGLRSWRRRLRAIARANAAPLATTS